ncbi:MAG: hypothetical protein M1834_008476 [Cirrosporium novae-zelandiae]|nr:MAG: hypothetical protein M1834_008476 [Cirrosporium novae-zelandiae]
MSFLAPPQPNRRRKSTFELSFSKPFNFDSPDSSSLSFPLDNGTGSTRPRSTCTMDVELKSRNLGSASRRKQNFESRELKDRAIRRKESRRRMLVRYHNLYMSDEEDDSSTEGETYSPIDDGIDEDEDSASGDDDNNSTTDEAKAVHVVFSGKPLVIDVLNATTPMQNHSRPRPRTISRATFSGLSHHEPHPLAALHTASTTSVYLFGKQREDSRRSQVFSHRISQPPTSAHPYGPRSSSLFSNRNKKPKLPLDTSVDEYYYEYNARPFADGDVNSPARSTMSVATPSSYLDFDPFASPIERHNTALSINTTKSSSRSRAGSISHAALKGLSRKFSFVSKRKSRSA